MTDILVKLPLAAAARLRQGAFGASLAPQSEYSNSLPRVEYAPAGGSGTRVWLDGSSQVRGLLAITAVSKSEVEANQIAASVVAHMVSLSPLSFQGTVIGEISGPARVAGPLKEGDEFRIPITVPLTGY